MIDGLLVTARRAVAAAAARCRWCSANASRSFCTATCFCSGVRMIWRESTTLIVPVGLARNASTVKPNRLWVSSTAVDRSGPICAGLFTPSAATE